MLSYNEIKERKYIVLDGTPYECLDSHVSRKQQNKPVNKTKLRNLLTNAVIEKTFQVSDNVPEADITKKKIVFIYARNDEFWFHSEGDPSNRFFLDVGLLSEIKDFLKEKIIVDAIVWIDAEEDEKIIGVRLPVKMEFVVIDAPPNVRGDTATGGDKVVTIETGAKIKTPLFIETGQTIVVNTETREYVERVKG